MLGEISALFIWPVLICPSKIEVYCQVPMGPSGWQMIEELMQLSYKWNCQEQAQCSTHASIKSNKRPIVMWLSHNHGEITSEEVLLEILPMAHAGRSA